MRWGIRKEIVMLGIITTEIIIAAIIFIVMKIKNKK